MESPAACTSTLHIFAADKCSRQQPAQLGNWKENDQPPKLGEILRRQTIKIQTDQTADGGNPIRRRSHITENRTALSLTTKLWEFIINSQG